MRNLVVLFIHFIAILAACSDPAAAQLKSPPVDESAGVSPGLWSSKNLLFDSSGELIRK
jgi:hypothetical protein